MNINIDEMIKDMREALLIENKTDRVETFLNLMPNEDVIKIIENTNNLTEEQLMSINDILSQIKIDLIDYKYHLDIEQNKLNNTKEYIY